MWRSCSGVVLAGGFAEWRLGTARALVAGLVVHLVAVGAAMALVLGAAGHGLGWPTGLTHHSDLGMTTALLGAAAAASATLSPGWRLRLRALLVGYAALALVVAGGLADLERRSASRPGSPSARWSPPPLDGAAGGPPCRPPAGLGALALLVVALVTLPHAVGRPGRWTGELAGGLPPAPPSWRTSCCCWPPSFSSRGRGVTGSTARRRPNRTRSASWHGTG